MEKIPQIKDYMSTDVITLKSDMNVYAAIDLLLKHNISGAPVIDDGKLVGVLSEKDCLRLLANGSFFELPAGSVRDFMSKGVRKVHPESDLFAAADIFLQNRFRRLPVVKNGKLVGQISRRDITRAISIESNHEVKIDKGNDNGYLTDEMKGALAE